MAGGLAGAIASVAGNPFDVLKTRMMAYEGSEKRGFGFYASEVIKKQGFAGFYKGIEVNIMRASILNATKMGCYDQCKYTLKKAGIPNGIPL